MEQQTAHQATGPRVFTGLAPTLPQRVAAGIIDFTICFAIAVVIGLAWLYSEVGLCECSTAEEIADFVEAASLTARGVAPGLALLPIAIYGIWSWTPLSGGRTIGMRAMRIRVIRA